MPLWRSNPNNQYPYAEPKLSAVSSKWRCRCDSVSTVQPLATLTKLEKLLRGCLGVGNCQGRHGDNACGLYRMHPILQVTLARREQERRQGNRPDTPILRSHERESGTNLAGGVDNFTTDHWCNTGFPILLVTRNEYERWFGGNAYEYHQQVCRGFAQHSDGSPSIAASTAKCRGEDCVANFTHSRPADQSSNFEVFHSLI